MKIAKYILLLCVLIGVGYLVYKIIVLPPPINIKDVENVIQTDGAKQYITRSDYDKLAQDYANIKKSDDEEGNPDTTGFYEYIADLLLDNGYDPAEILPKDEPEKVLSNRTVLYLDNTASMKGYLKPKTLPITDFVDILNGMSAFYGDNIESYYVNKDSLEKIDFEGLVTKLNSKKVATYDAYPMNQFLETIVKSSKEDTDHNVINFFLTDAIPSGTNAEINGDPEFNKVQKSTLERRIGNAMKDANGYGLSIYQFNANYDDAYINYTNNKKGKTINPKGQRPVYLIVIGDNNLVKEFKERAEKGEINYFKHVRSLHSTNAYSDKAAVTVVGVEHGSAERDDDDFILPNKVKEYTVNLSLNGVPEYLIDASDISNPGVEVPFVITINGFDKTAALRENGNITYDANNNILQIKAVRSSDGDEEEMKISFKDQLPFWVQQTSCEEDLDVNQHPGQTFNFDILVNGLIRGINGFTGKTIGEPIEIDIKFEN